MRKLFLLSVVFFIVLLVYFNLPLKAFAVENPLAVPNNKFGIHILFPDEIIDAAKLVNTNGGLYGYVVIPIQAGDKDLKKWQLFMDRAKALQLIPIVRLATEGDYFNTKVWRKPRPEDLVDFANFLNSLRWPTKNRYIIVFNEPNRADEWGGKLSPGEYAQILSYSVTVFKSKNQNFFIISAGMDNAAANNGDISMNAYDYFRQMNSAVPGIFNQIDGFSSHSYPNPAFSQPPSKQDNQSIASFKFERAFIKSMSNKDLPAFITETGWSKERLSENQIAEYYKTAYTTVWNDDSLVCITPFILRADTMPFINFSFLDKENPNILFRAVESLSKTKGTPVIETEVLGENIKNPQAIVVKNFTDNSSKKKTLGAKAFNIIFSWLLKLD
ncbi:MAG: glycosyl hydrolase [Patescibacteria group bacterium]|nr:glycosyl hydrolase [Patescibacteria group bacterium]